MHRHPILVRQNWLVDFHSYVEQINLESIPIHSNWSAMILHDSVESDYLFNDTVCEVQPHLTKKGSVTDSDLHSTAENLAR